MNYTMLKIIKAEAMRSTRQTRFFLQILISAIYFLFSSYRKRLDLIFIYPPGPMILLATFDPRSTPQFKIDTLSTQSLSFIPRSKRQRIEAWRSVWDCWSCRLILPIGPLWIAIGPRIWKAQAGEDSRLFGSNPMTFFFCVVEIVTGPAPFHYGSGFPAVSPNSKVLQ